MEKLLQLFIIVKVFTVGVSNKLGFTVVGNTSQVQLLWKQSGSHKAVDWPQY